MRTIDKALAGSIALGLVAGALAAPAVARKRPKPATQTYYLVNANEELGCAKEGLVLRLTPSTENHSQCMQVETGPSNEAYAAIFGEPCRPDPTSPSGRACATRTFTADEGLPLRLDATRPLTGTIYVHSLTIHPDIPGAAAGPATLHVAVLATIAGEELVLGEASAEYLVTPHTQPYEVPFEIALDPALDEAAVTELSLRLWTGGVSPTHGIYQFDTSHVVVPVRK